MIQVSMLTIKSTQWAAPPTSSLWQKRLRDNTLWPDGITAKSLHNVDFFHVLFNTFLVTEYTLRWLRKGVVMLVPKIANPSRPSDYRPTTVCPKLLRCYHGIAQWMKSLLLLDHQKGKTLVEAPVSTSIGMSDSSSVSHSRRAGARSAARGGFLVPELRVERGAS